MVHDGALEVVTTLASGSARYVPQLALFEFPYIYKDEAHLVRVLNALEPEVSRLLASSNMVAIGGQNMGLRHMLNKKRPIQTVADMKGLKMRGPNPVYVGMFNALGASGTTTDWSEIYGAIQAGVIDGMEASPDMIYSMKFHEVAPVFEQDEPYRRLRLLHDPQGLAGVPSCRSQKNRAGLGPAGGGISERAGQQCPE